MRIRLTPPRTRCLRHLSPSRSSRLNYSTPQSNQSTVNTAYTNAQTAGSTNIISEMRGTRRREQSHRSPIPPETFTIRSSADTRQEQRGHLLREEHRRCASRKKRGQGDTAVPWSTSTYVSLSIRASTQPTRWIALGFEQQRHQWICPRLRTWGYYGNATNGFTTRVLTQQTCRASSLTHCEQRRQLCGHRASDRRWHVAHANGGVQGRWRDLRSGRRQHSGKVGPRWPRLTLFQWTAVAVRPAWATIGSQTML